MQSHAYMPTPEAAGLPDSLPPPHRPQDGGQHEVVRSILSSPEGSSAGWFMFIAQTNLHEGGESFVGTRLLPGNFASLGCPQSRGATHVSPADPNAPPAIDPRYLSHPADLEILAPHVRALETKLCASEALAPFSKPVGRRDHPDAFLVGDLDGAKKYVLDTATMAYHSCGSAAMLPRDKGGIAV